MRGAALPAALLCAALGLMLASSRWRTLAIAILLLCASACLASLVPPGRLSVEVAFGGCWASVILLAAAVHLRSVPAWLACVAALDAGFWVGSVISAEGHGIDLIEALPCVLIGLPAHLIRQRGWGIGIKVVSSWLIAVALLAALLPTATATPGYVPDHMD